MCSLGFQAFVASPYLSVFFQSFFGIAPWALIIIGITVTTSWENLNIHQLICVNIMNLCDQSQLICIDDNTPKYVILYLVGRIKLEEMIGLSLGLGYKRTNTLLQKPTSVYFGYYKFFFSFWFHKQENWRQCLFRQCTTITCSHSEALCSANG